MRAWIAHCYSPRLVTTRAKTWGDRPTWRRGYVERQLAVARQALCLGSTAAARAALRVLSGEDFVDSREATVHLRTVRDRTSEDDQVMAALHRLCSLEPRGDSPRLVRTG